MTELESMEDRRWKGILVELESVARGEIAEARLINQWLNSWGKPNELSAPEVPACKTWGVFS